MLWVGVVSAHMPCIKSCTIAQGMSSMHAAVLGANNFTAQLMPPRQGSMMVGWGETGILPTEAACQTMRGLTTVKAFTSLQAVQPGVCLQSHQAGLQFIM